MNGQDQPGRRARRAATRDAEGRGRFAAWLSLPVLIFLILPTLIVIPLSFAGTPSVQFPPASWSLRWYEALADSQQWQDAALRSFLAALCTMALATPIGTAAALAIHRQVGVWSDSLRVIVLLPLVVPSILIAVGVLFIYAPLGLNNSFLGLVLAHLALTLPVVLVTIEAGLKQVDDTLAQAARSLGARPLYAFLTVTLPQMKASLLAAGLFAFLGSFDEIAVAFFISSGEQATLPKRMFSALRDSFDPTIAAVSTLLILLTALVIGFSLLKAKPASRA